MSARLTPIENPSSPLMKLAYYFNRKQVGKVIAPLKVIYARLPLPFALWMNKMFSLENKLPLSAELRLLIRTHVAQLNSCSFCIDISKATAMQKFKDTEKFFQLHDFESSPLFSEKEKIALRLATEITNKKVSDATFAQAKNHFSEQELIGISWMVSSEHVLNLMNLSFDLASDGLCRR